MQGLIWNTILCLYSIYFRYIFTETFIIDLYHATPYNWMEIGYTYINSTAKTTINKLYISNQNYWNTMYDTYYETSHKIKQTIKHSINTPNNRIEMWFYPKFRYPWQHLRFLSLEMQRWWEQHQNYHSCLLQISLQNRQPTRSTVRVVR